MVFLSGILIGLIGSLHCVGMCGPIVMAVNYRKKGLLKNLLYHTGRLISYVALGVLFGLLGAGISLAGIQQGVSIVAGITIIMITLIPQLKMNALQSKWQLKMITPLKRKLLGVVNKGTPAMFFSLGLLNGLLPCGLVYVAIAAAVATSGLADAIFIMAGFGLGTWPLMLSLAFGGSWLMGRFRVKLKYAIPTVAILMGTILIFRGMALDIPFISPVLTNVFGDNITVCHTP